MRSNDILAQAEPATGIRIDDNAVALGGLGKRVFDVFCAIAGLALLWPLFLVTYVAVRMTSPGPVFFSHQRIGLGGRSFPCYKFRSMIPTDQFDFDAYLRDNPEAAEEWHATQKLRYDPRITPIGNFLRKSSIDELPQLWNVIKGDMSIVGPRPIVTNEISRYGNKFGAYTSALPGITGLWQVMGRSDCSYTQRVAYDVDYVQNWSLRRDIAIILGTVVAVFKRQGSF